jgi:LPXTG-motif cell wall-anchored protein
MLGAVLLIVSLLLLACIWLLSATRADASPRCGGPCPTYPTTTGATTTAATTTQAPTTTVAPTTTAKQTTTTVGLGFCVPAPGVLCVNIDPTTVPVPTTAATTTVATTVAPTTTPSVTTAVDRTLPPAQVAPATSVTPTAAPQSLPVTGGNGELAVLGIGLLLLGGVAYTLKRQ